MPEQEVRKQRGKKPTIGFDPHKVGADYEVGRRYGPEDAKAGDLQDPTLDRDAATYRARKGQGGDRIRGLI